MRRVLLMALLIGGCGNGNGASDMATIAPLPDLRFKWVDAFPSYTDAGDANVSERIFSGWTGEPAMTPLGVGHGDCAALAVDAGPILGLEDGGSTQTDCVRWAAATFRTPVPVVSMTVKTFSGFTQAMFADIDSLLSNTPLVITSLDTNEFSTYGLTAIGPTNDSAYANHSVFSGARAQLDSWAMREGAQGRVVTALAPTGATLVALSFARQGDASVYETRIVDADFGSLADQASALAGAGFVITALGRSGIGSFVLVGTRRSGDTTTHSADTVMRSHDVTLESVLQPLLGVGKAVVGIVTDEPSSTDVFGHDLIVTER